MERIIYALGTIGKSCCELTTRMDFLHQFKILCLFLPLQCYGGPFHMRMRKTEIIKTIITQVKCISFKTLNSKPFKTSMSS